MLQAMGSDMIEQLNINNFLINQLGLEICILGEKTPCYLKVSELVL